MSEHRERSNWVRNLLREPAVRFSIGTRKEAWAVCPERPARARMVPDDDGELVGAVRALMDEKYDWSDGLVVEIAATCSGKGALP